MQYIRVWCECGDPIKYEEHYLIFPDFFDFDRIEETAVELFNEYRYFYRNNYNKCSYNWRHITKEEYDNYYTT